MANDSPLFTEYAYCVAGHYIFSTFAGKEQAKIALFCCR